MSAITLQALQCPITHDIMVDPAKAPDGHTYERAAIEEAIRRNGKSPITRQPMRIDQLVTDYTLKNVIEELSSSKTEEVVVKDEPVTVTTRTHAGMTQVTLWTPDGEAAPLDVAFVIDISGSMATEVSSGESDGFSILDVVKHAILTCLEGFRPQDKVSLVVYSTEARVLMPSRRMDAGGKACIKIKLAGMDAENSTNIWDGLRLGLEQLPRGGTVFLLTDGQPNRSPPRGEVHELKKALDGRDDIVVNTFGFGYNLDTALLLNLARATQGSYSFIPDIGLVGTIFVHAMANLCTSTTKHFRLAIETEGTIVLPEAEKTSWGYFLPVGRITKGQPRDIFIECAAPVTITMLDTEVTVLSERPVAADRQMVAMGIQECLKLANMDYDNARGYLNGLVGAVTDPKLQEDLNGQVREAIEPENYRRWGRHYLPSLALAHWTQRCNNFLDKGIQEYGGETFQKMRDVLDTAFNKLPAPKPTHREAVVSRARAAGTTVRAAPQSMRSYNMASGPCFAGPCRVKMSDSSLKACQDIQKDDIVETRQGPAKVVCVVKTPCQIATLVKYGTLMATPWHPVMHEGRWTFPNELGEAAEYPCAAVYSFLLEPGFQDMYIENVPCITLAHGIENDAVATHEFFGTQAVVSALQDHFGFDSGIVEVQGVKRDTETNLVNGFIF
jgi:Mg-chelatase subunit ChlD